MIYQFGKFAIIVLAVCFFQTTVLAANTNQIKVGLVITDQIDRSTGNNNTSAKYTCNAARTKISLSGYKSVEVLQCEGTVYRFSGRSNSGTLIIGFNAVTGQISII
jgi:hypothetical protein